MGLDMYLEKRTYVKQWDHQSAEEKHEVVVTNNLYLALSRADLDCRNNIYLLAICNMNCHL